MADKGEVNRLAQAAQREALTRPVVGGKTHTERQAELDTELAQPLAGATRDSLSKGKITQDELDEAVK